MKKNNGWIYFVVGFILVIAFAIIVNNNNVVEEKEFKEITLTYFLEELEKEDVYLYLGYPECPYCQQLEPLLLQVQNELKKDINYINTNAMSDLEKSKLPEIHDIFKGEWGTPVLLNVSKGQVVDYNMGLVDINTLRTFYNLETKEEESLLEEINFTQFKELIKSEERQIVFFGYPECPYCQKTKPILEEISEEEGLDIKYININNFDKTIVTELSELSEAFEGEWGVPLIITAKDGQVLKYISGLREKSVFLNFFDEE